MSKYTIIPAAYLFLKSDDRILLSRRYNTGFEDGNYSFIAGHLMPHESCSMAIIRESAEEAGLIISPEDLEVVHVLHRKAEDHDKLATFFAATKWAGEIRNLEPTKCDDLSWFHIDELPTNIIPYISHVIEQVSRGVPYSEFGW